MARSFNGSSDQIDCGGSVPSPSGSISISARVNMSSLSPAYSAVYSRVKTGGVVFHQIFVKSSGQIAYYLRGSALLMAIDPGSGTISTGGWHQIGLTFDPVGGLTGYLDGSSDGTAAASGILSAFGAEHTSIGNDLVNAGRFLGGSIADCAIWSGVALSTGEIAALARGIRPHTIQPASIVGYWPIDGIQSPEPDLSGFANNGTLTGTAFAAGPPLAMFTPRRPMSTDLPPVGPTLMGQICM